MNTFQHCLKSVWHPMAAQRMVLQLGGVVLLLVLVGVPASVQARVLEGLFAVTETVADRSRGERFAAEVRGLREVLVRVSGRESVLREGAVRAALDRSDRYVAQFGYRTVANPDSSVSGEGGSEVTRTELDLVYDAAAITALLRENNLPVLSLDRPVVMLWLAHELNGRRQILDSGSSLELRDELMRAAQRRGVALQLPGMDATDQRSVQSGDIWGRFMQPLADASTRYGGNVVVAARLEGRQNLSISVTLQSAGELDSLAFSAVSPQDAAQTLIDEIADVIAARYAVAVAAGGEQMLLAVTGVTELADYAALTTHMSKQIAIRSAYPYRVAGERCEWLVTLAGSRAELEQALALERRLRPSTAPTPDSAPRAGSSDTRVPAPGPAGAAFPVVNEAPSVSDEPSAGSELSGNQQLSVVAESTESLPVAQYDTLYYEWRR